MVRQQRTRVVLLLGLVAGLLVIVLWERLRRPAGPLYQGQPVSYWRERIQEYEAAMDPDPLPDWLREWVGVRETTYHSAPFMPVGWGTLMSIDPDMSTDPEPEPDRELLPVLLELVKDRDPQVRAYAAGFLGRYARNREVPAVLIALLDDMDVHVRCVAIRQLAAMGKDALVALPALVERCDDVDGECQLQAALAVWKVGKDKVRATRVLGTALTGSHHHQAVHALGEMGLDAEGAFDQLAAATRHEDRLMRMYAIGVLSNFGKRSVEVVEAALSDEDSCVRGHAIAALARIGHDARAAVPSLIRLLDDPGKHVRDDALNALKKIRPGEASPSQQ